MSQFNISSIFPSAYTVEVLNEPFSTVSSSESFHSSSSSKVFKSFVQDIFSSKNLNTGIVPPGLLYHNSHIVVFEKPSTIKNVYYRPYMIGDMPSDPDIGQKIFSLPIPWQVYIAVYTVDPYSSKPYVVDVYMFFRNSQINSFDDFVYLAPLSNFYANGKLCRPFFDSFDDIDRYAADLSGVISAAYDWVWNANTNLDLTASIAEYYISFQNSLDEEKYFIFDNLPSGRESVRHAVHDTSFYVSPDIVKTFYRVWEKLSLEDILDISWSNPGYYEKSHDDQNAAADQVASEISHYQFLAFLNDNGIDTDEYSEDHLENLSFSDFDFSNQDILSYFDVNPRFEQKTLKQVLENMSILPEIINSRSFSKDFSSVYAHFLA